MAQSGWLRACALVGAAGMVTWALVGTTWRTAEGILTVAACLPLSAAVAATVLAVAAATPYRRAATWFALALVGQAVTLQLVQAGPQLRYQHYPPLGILAARHPWLLAFLGVQALSVAAAFGRGASRDARQSAPVSKARLVIAVGLAVTTAATVSPDPTRYAAELAFAALLQGLGIATLVLAALAVPERAAAAAVDRVNRALEAGSGGSAGGRDWFGWMAAAAATALAVALSIWSYQRHPHLPDEVVYLQHARYFAAGMLTMPAPPVRSAFDVDLMSYEPDRWFSPVPPGWPALLAIGARMGVPWLVNPVLSGICVLLAYAVLRRWYPRRTARWGTALLAASPWFLFLGMSYMTHTVTLTCALIAAWGMTRAQEGGRFGWGLVAGVGVGATSLIRPLDGLLVGILIALWALGAGGRRLRVPALAGLAIGTVVTGALVYPYNRALTGDGLTFPINAYTDRLYGRNSNAYGFGSDRGLGWAIDPNPGHGPVDGVINANLNTFGLNTDLFGWSTGSLVLIALLVCSGRMTGTDRRMIAASLVIVTGYFFYYFSGGPEFGARYWFPIVVPLVALTARGLEILEETAGARASFAVAALIAMSLVNYMPWRAMDKYRNLRGMRPDVSTLAVEHGFSGDLVFVRGNRFPDYASAAVLNPVDLRAPATVYAWDRDDEARAETLRAYPNRRIWVVDGPSRTRSGYRVAAGPLAPGAHELHGIHR